MSEPHVPNPVIDTRFDLRKLSRMANIGMNQIYRRNMVSGEIEDNEKMFNGTIRAIIAKHGLRKNRLDTQAFYDSNEDYGAEYAGAMTNPYMNVHFGAKEPPKLNHKKPNRTAQQNQQNQNQGRWVRIGGGAR
jgi:hypothetical protein